MSDERESLLAAEHRADSPRSRRRARPRPNPLPKVQLAVVYAIKLVVPIASTQAMPYMNVLVSELAASSGAETGYYSGLVGSASSTAHLLTIYMWGRLSDKYGRKPVIIIGTVWTILFTLLFGVSRTLSAVILTRFLTGIFSGTTGAIHSVVGELADSTNESVAFPLYDIVSAVGFAVGPLIGGTFANPAEQFPGRFTSPFWRAYPYFLPCLVTSLIALAALILAIFVLDETHPVKRRKLISVDVDSLDHEEPISTHRHNTSGDEDDVYASSQPLSIKSLLSIPVIQMVCASSGALSFVAGCFNTVFVLQAYSPINHGGLALSPPEIGRALGIMGTVSIFLKLLMPPLLRRFGVLTVFRWCMRSWLVTFASMSLLSVVAKQVEGAGGKAVEWTAISFVLFLSRIGCMAFSIIMILTKDHTPGTSSLGTSNGMAEFAQSLMGVFSPTIVSSLFAFSATHNVLGGQFWVVVLVLLSVLFTVPAERLRKYRDD
ncbi:hypothetical protein IEO21_09135 [Rhodonia placenta]|uniref:Major facilitator superfamily (MFS) profile domain-containing protein n=2 Tax=Rhodonia placenta TaxID=104341 RepID=A0A1X6NCJ0_9APHY|nr:hypothetical protein POSPLADRAFT_1133326 [Postia placenta MAD-698-R-SB12]KAF9805229.1 hypothetical protein IEO21_09135 [Postia placenta]OSX66093.1 hypothetical protein POSPLADRAFT_1133326 [Postia placenta MAD-698-R-SB12]